MKIASLAAGVINFAVSSAAAQTAEPPYLDNRSDADAVIRSLYNAIDRHEYARAWDYFGDTKPAKDFAAFVDGYAGTDKVDVETGGVANEGAAGSIYYTVPVAIRATQKDGSEKIFAGCYTLRQINGGIQEPPSRPIQIDKGNLKSLQADELAAAVPTSCDDGPTPPMKDAALEQAKQDFAATYGKDCDAMTPDGDPNGEPQAYSLRYKDASAAADEPEREVRLFRFFCSSAAYNEDAVYYVWDEVAGVRQLQFASPELDIRYEGDGDEKVSAIHVIGFQVDDRLVNSDYDEATKTITSHARWRGVGDASSSGTYLFRNGNFSLVQYDVDASYDGEANPRTVVDYNTAP